MSSILLPVPQAGGELSCRPFPVCCSTAIFILWTCKAAKYYFCFHVAQRSGNASAACLLQERFRALVCLGIQNMTCILEFPISAAFSSRDTIFH